MKTMRRLALLVGCVLSIAGAAAADDGAVDTAQGGFDSDLVPVRRVEPQWPRAALIKGISGWVRLRGVVRVDGSVRDVTVEDSSPYGVFDRAALDAVKRWRFEPATKGGVAVEREITQTISFDLLDDAAYGLALGLVKQHPDRAAAIYADVRGVCPDSFEHADDPVNAALRRARLPGGMPPKTLEADPKLAAGQIQTVGRCLFTSWEQVPEPDLYVLAVDYGPLSQHPLDKRVDLALRAYAAAKHTAQGIALLDPQTNLKARAWILDQLWVGYLEIIHQRAALLPFEPAAAPEVADALDRANQALERFDGRRAIALLEKALDTLPDARAQAELTLALARAEIGEHQLDDATNRLERIVVLPGVPWNLVQASRLVLARLYAERTDLTRFDSTLAALDAELGVSDKLAF